MQKSAEWKDWSAWNGTNAYFVFGVKGELAVVVHLYGDVNE
ncbi:hypothetical protein [Thaumasiovibrio sp. DFM-14]